MKIIFYGLLYLCFLSKSYSIPITQNSFSGQETFQNFNNFTPSDTFGTPVVDGVTYQSLTPGNSRLLLSGLGNFFSNIPGSSQGLNLRAGGTNPTRLKISFSTQVNRVGILVATTPSILFSLTAFNDASEAIESVTGLTPAFQTAVFLGLETTQNISHIEINELNSNSQDTLFDDLRFEEVIFVPEPGSWLLITLSCFLILSQNFKSK